jgi:transketolase
MIDTTKDLHVHGFSRDITSKEIGDLQEKARLCRGDIIKMTTLAGSGHPGGSMSSIDIYLILYSFARISPDKTEDVNRDRIIVSHGHTSPGLYSCLARLGYVELEEVLTGFRHVNSPFEGHIERHVPGIEWTTGNLGQGLSAGCGFALAALLNDLDYSTFVFMSDGEQAKGQVAEARRFARKYSLNNLTVIIDHNHIQISGRTEEIMPVNIKEDYLADGWKVLEIPGHNFKEIHGAIKKALEDDKHPYAIVAETTMGKGVSFMENQREYHGRALNAEEYKKAMRELGISDDLAEISQKGEKKNVRQYKHRNLSPPALDPGTPRVYDKDTHPRAAFGTVLLDIAERNPKVPMAVLDCDLCESVKSEGFARIRPENFFESGVSEHTTATIAGALSVNGIFTIWADFGVFAIDEVYNQLRLNDINNTDLKICATHLGYNVGPDGKTHHCIDYIGLLRNLLGFRLIIPGAPNQTDHAVRYMLQQRGNYVIGITRSKLPIVKNADDENFFNQNYNFEYGKADLIRQGTDCSIMTYGAMLHLAIMASEKLGAAGISTRVYNIASPLHIDVDTLREAADTKLVVAYEDHIKGSGLGSIVAQAAANEKIRMNLLTLGICQYGESDSAEVLYKKHGLDTDTVVRTIIDRMASNL